jgi:hypothetical protein
MEYNAFELEENLTDTQYHDSTLHAMFPTVLKFCFNKFCSCVKIVYLELTIEHQLCAKGLYKPFCM